jgi:hypothetical protein
VTTSSSVVKAVPHPIVLNGSDTTQLIGAGSFLSSNDGFSEDGTAGGAVLDFAGNDETEIEFVIEIVGGDVTVGQTIDFRMVETDDTILGNYNFTPTITIIDPVITTVGVNDRTTTISAVSGSDPYTVTITDGSTAKVGDACWDEHAVPRKYRITAISGNDLTVVDSEGVGSAPDNSGTTTPSDIKRYYSTLSSWEGDLDDTDLYQAGDDAIADMYADADFNMGALTVNGGGTVKLNSTMIRAASGEEHTGTPGTGVTIKGASVTGVLFTASSATVFTRFQHVEIDFNGDSGDSSANLGVEWNNSALIAAVRRMMVHNSARRLSNGIRESSGYGWIHNNMLFNFVYAGTSAAISVAGIRLGTSRVKDVQNNTVHEWQYSNVSNNGDIYGIITLSDHANIEIRNNIATDVTTAGGGTVQCFSPSSPSNAVMDYNLDTDGTAAGVNSLNNESSANEFVSNSAPYNLHLASGANAIDEGVDLGTTPRGVNLDMDLRDRNAEADTWDMGCDEFVPVGGLTIPIAMHHYKQMMGVN